MPKYKDPNTNKFISEEEAKKRGIKPIEGLSFQESAEKFIKERCKQTGESEEEVVKDLFSGEVAIVEFNEATGKASLQFFSGAEMKAINKMTNEELFAEYKDLRENFAPVSAGIEYHKTFLVGSGFDVLADDPSDKHKIQMRDEIKELSRTIYMDYYRQGLDKILFIMADDLLTYGASAAEVIFWKDITYGEFGELGEEGTIKSWDEFGTKEWKSLKGIRRLKIIDNAITRLIPYIDSKSLEVKYWSLDEKVDKSVTQEIQEKVGTAKKKDVIKFYPFEIFWLSWNTRGTSLIGESIIKPALEIARLVRRIQQSIGKGFERWADRKYFFICGTEKRPWNKNAQRQFLKYLEIMIKNNWTGIPVPQGFDIKNIGGEVFEGTNILNHLINMICAAMNYPRDFLEQGRTRAGDKAWLAWQVKYGTNQRMMRRDIEHQLFEKHLWCKFGKTYKVPKQGVDVKERETVDIYIPKIEWKAEGRWQRAEEIKTLQGWLNVANPIGPEFKLSIERRGAELMGFGDIEFPSFKELRREMKRAERAEELRMQQQEARLQKRQKKGVSTALAPTGKEKRPPPSAGGTRQPKLIKEKALREE